MLIKNGSYQNLVDKIKTRQDKIIIYGTGMIGQIVVPYLVKEYNLYDHLECFIDIDERKRNKKIKIDNRQYEVKSPDYLNAIDGHYILLITNSNFFSVIKFLDSIPGLNDIEGYIIPMMQICALKDLDEITITRKCKEQLIPKKIHYCWFGDGKVPWPLMKCIESWKIHCPEYEIIEWNEHNYDVNKYAFTKEAYENQKYGFVSDVARLDILYEYGGIYFDTDVTLLKSLDDFLHQEGFIGTEKWGNINTGGGCGFVPKHPMIKKMLEYREQVHFVLEDGMFNIETNGIYETKPFLKSGFKPNNRLQIVEDVTVYPSYVNHPYDYMSCELQKKETTVSIHHFYGGWMEEDDRLNRKNTQDQYKSMIKRISNGGK